LATCRELGAAVVCSSPLSRGLLSSKFSKGELLTDEADMRSKIMPRFQDGNREQNEKIVTQFKALADKKGCTISQLGLAWLLKQGDDIFPIPGTKQQKYLAENLGALDISLTDDEEAEIRAFVEKTEVAGWVVPPAYKSYIFRDTKEESG
jgi:aryl-alcohol dehydrogenase-like predicted oxidoreductase